MRVIAGLLALLLIVDAQAQTVQKCVARDGHARYQSEPCGRGEKVAEVWDATPEDVPPPRASRTRRTGRVTSTASGRVRRTAAWQGTRDVAETGGDACTRARAYRDAAERRAGLARNYDLLSMLQSRVFEACR